MTERSDPTQPEVDELAPDPDLVATRARLLPEERRTGSDDPVAEAAEILAESEERTVEAAEGADELDVERRTSEETVPPPGS